MEYVAASGWRPVTPHQRYVIEQRRASRNELDAPIDDNAFRIDLAAVGDGLYARRFGAIERSGIEGIDIAGIYAPEW